ncbi:MULTISPECIES: hypothetical protein [Sphingomonadaceae]|uniref:Type IV secretion system protein VirD4 n=1 Tax=Sphingomonas sp. SH TaxID=849864 RepID=A0A109PM53_9SPHN|nr:MULTISPECIES: hypothetical protein [Sphingomonadaceae]AJR27126.1 hypothetical protein TZ53_25375 [Sphingobium sp. YBL2]ALZ45850.1 Type IV secretion system protein VirD4 [Sphingomonas sp. SH]KKC24523.1 hypothetical protein WP12_18945 [Sphingomonas sp. SRS2]QBM06568.1 type IV secretion system protein VirD4 [uncultured bacterium]
MISIVNTECHVPKTFSDLAEIAASGRLGQIMRMRPDQLLLLRQGEHPLAVEKIRYYDQREFAGLFDPA